MGKKKKEDESEVVSLVSENPDIPKPRLHKLIIKNFRSIGKQPIEIELDDIVVLVGPNNVGKSSILKAYEVVMNQGALALDDFPNGIVDNNNIPEIELQTIVFDNSPGEQWIKTTDEGEKLVRERWIWKKEGKPERQGFHVVNDDWDEHVPWGAPNVAKSRRPEPHRINAFDSPDVQSKAIIELLMKVLNERLKNIKDEGSEKTAYEVLLENVKDFQNRVVKDSQDEINDVENEISELISKVFPNYKIKFDAKAEENLDKTINFFKANPQLLMGPEDGYLSTIEKQGSGARRTLLWTALRIITENNKKNLTKSDRPNVLLLDEPEICLHPSAIRDACNVLYNLPQSGRWQVMITTHSPAFIDISRDNTTIIRVNKTKEGEIKGTTVFRPTKIKLTEGDRGNLKLLNIFDPYVAEFFFGGKTIIVEGDTEHTAFKYIISRYPDKYKNIHIIRARGKATIVSLIKILNQFGSDYSVLHDSDTPKVKRKDGTVINNGAWTKNKDIADEVNKKASSCNVRLVASIPNFEEAYLSEKMDKEKPYNALLQLRENDVVFLNIEKLLNVLISNSVDFPENCVEWNDLSILEKKFTGK